MVTYTLTYITGHNNLNFPMATHDGFSGHMSRRNTERIAYRCRPYLYAEFHRASCDIAGEYHHLLKSLNLLMRHVCWDTQDMQGSVVSKSSASNIILRHVLIQPHPRAAVSRDLRTHLATAPSLDGCCACQTAALLDERCTIFCLSRCATSAPHLCPQ
jgi:arginine/lysine/ornithine decarboxylase